MFVVTDLLQNWLCFKFCQDTVFSFFFLVRECFAVFVQKISSAVVILNLSCPFSVQVLLPYSGVSIADVFYVHSLVCFWTSSGFRTHLVIPIVCKHLVDLVNLSPTYHNVHPR